MLTPVLGALSPFLGAVAALTGAVTDGGWQYALAEQLLPHLEFYVSRLDVVGPHLPLLRPHIGQLLRYEVMGKVSPHVERLLAMGPRSLAISANADILLFYLGWLFALPVLPRFFLSLPFAPRLLSWLATHLPKRWVRRCTGVECSVELDFGSNWNSLCRQ